MHDCPHCDRYHRRGSSECPARRLDEGPVGEKYRLETLLGVGGYGAVYRATHLGLESPVALKMLLPNSSEEIKERFLREAKAAAAIRHPAVVLVTDCGVSAGQTPYLVMEYLEGRNLAELVRERGMLSPGKAVSIAVDALDGLTALHRKGIIHRDIKPENLFLALTSDSGEQVKILDFGIAKLARKDRGITISRVFMGSVLYASPEQVNDSKNVDPRTDIYSLGAVLFFLLTGRHLVEGDTEAETMVKIVQGEVERHPAHYRAELSKDLDNTVARALAHQREDRFQESSEMKTALENNAVLTSRGGRVSLVVRVPGRPRLASPKSEPSTTLLEESALASVDKGVSTVDKKQALGNPAGETVTRAEYQSKRSMPEPRPVKRRSRGKRSQRALWIVLLGMIVVLVAVVETSVSRRFQPKVLDVLPVSGGESGSETGAKTELVSEPSLDVAEETVSRVGSPERPSVESSSASPQPKTSFPAPQGPPSESRIQEIPSLKAKRIPIPEPTPDPPEPIRADDLEATVDLPEVEGIFFGIPDPPLPPYEGPVYVGGEVVPPEKIFAPAPQYTQMAWKARIQGAVIVQAIITKQGEVGNVKILRGLPFGLEEEVLKAFKRWRFKPATLNGRPVDVYYNLTANFRHPSAENQERILRGVEEWNRWREENSETRLDLSGAKLAKTDLTGANLTGADLSEADLSEADLSYANLRGADLRGAILYGSDLIQARNITQAQIESARGNYNTELPEDLKRPEHW